MPRNIGGAVVGVGVVVVAVTFIFQDVEVDRPEGFVVVHERGYAQPTAAAAAEEASVQRLRVHGELV